MRVSLTNRDPDEKLNKNSDLLSRHLRLQSDSSGHEEIGNCSGILQFENSSPIQATHIESELDGATRTGLENEALRPLLHGYMNNLPDTVPSAFAARAAGQIQESEDTNVSRPILLPSDTSQNVLDENLEDLNVLWGNVDTNFSLEGLAFGLPNDLISLPGFDITGSTPSGTSGQTIDKATHQTIPDSPPSDDDASLSNFQLPSLQRNDESNSQEYASQDTDSYTNSFSKNQPNHPWRISNEDYHHISMQIDNIRPIIPNSFSLPSKYVLCRYIEGFFTGSHEHLPFLHLPTVSIANLSPLLILAIIAMGAQYRFERERAVRFYKASRSLIDHHISIYRQSNSVYTPRSHVETMDCIDKTHFEVLQAQIILTTLGTWGNHGLLHDSLEIAGQISLYLRDSGFLLHDRHSDDGLWSTWIQQEEQRRTIFIAYIICNNQTICYNIPPKILNSEISSLYLPWPEELWRASSASEWKSLRSKWPICVSFGDGYGQLFHNKRIHRDGFTLSSFGSLILIHGLSQNIYLAWEASFRMPVSAGDQPSSLPVEFLTKFHTALRRWQKSWETSSDPSITPSSPKGPLGFNATAIFRIACIRLHLNLGPHRSLRTGDPEVIASAFCNALRPAQTPQIYQAVLQSIHALSIPVRLGVEYVARTQTLTWSTIHALSNLECAVFLCKWLETLASDPSHVSKDTRRILRIITSVLREADLAPPVNWAGDFQPDQLRRMGAMLVRLLSEILKGPHVFEMMYVFCDSLRTYANLLENDLDSNMAE